MHNFVTDKGLRHAKQFVREGAEQANRNPDDIKLQSEFATALNLNEGDYLKKLVAPMATYMQAPGYIEILIELNEWDPEVLTAFRANELVDSIAGGIDSVATLEKLDKISELIPKEWLPAATGNAESCAQT